MLETKSDILSTTSGANSTTFISDINQSERTSTLDLQLVKSSVASVSKADTGILPVPPAGHALVTPSAAEDILSKLFGGISGDVISHTSEAESQSSTRSTTGYPYLSQVNNVDPQAMMMMATLLSLDASAQRVASMKNSNEIYTDGQNKALENKTLEFKKQLEEQQKAEEKAQKSKIVGQVFGWLGVAATAIAAIFNPALLAVVAISATAMALQTAVDVMGDKAPQALKTAAQAFGGLSLAAGILTAGIGGVSSLISKVGDVANKVGSNIVKAVTTLADTFVDNVASKISAVANGLTTSSRSIGTTVLNNDAAHYNVLSQISAFAVENLTRQSEYLNQSAKAELEKATLELQNQANYIQSASQLMSDAARVNSRIVSGRV
ncbi:YopB/SseC family type III secretion system translocon subunit [Escherichia coli]|uniref:type III secretion system translocon subunit SctE n=1 Tax=Escherichia coli TaxID=562 RepID=UPI000BDF12A8|nr:type III secretion system translocon subunit SctE [Escherichia coli]EFC7755462.1 YopB/SseC family type III secretion system translocon subunit [Escherichia coli]EFF9709250.1 secretion protein EspD [Escherichia coli]EFJ8671255.1 YopB/SseC family type III secretion system translocon subunit [Escherichia coli]EFL9245662.1 YopB/SseC family type III secretion system translocon subunit [Escherichia coli]EGK6798576.1 YopB/SseC family type III secretion system translocon subunit [Escherichia coli]